MAATTWNGHAGCGQNSVNGQFDPFGTGWIAILHDPNEITAYGSTAGYYFSNSGYVGTGVFNTSVHF
jgi:hypothetical protein